MTNAEFEAKAAEIRMTHKLIEERRLELERAEMLEVIEFRPSRRRDWLNEPAWIDMPLIWIAKGYSRWVPGWLDHVLEWLVIQVAKSTDRIYRALRIGRDEVV